MMGVLKTVQWSLGLMGYFESPEHNFSITQMKHGLVTLLDMTSLFMYLSNDANSTQDYIYSIFMIVVTISIFISFVNTSNNTALIFVFIGKLEKIINEGNTSVDWFLQEC